VSMTGFIVGVTWWPSELQWVAQALWLD